MSGFKSIKEFLLDAAEIVDAWRVAPRGVLLFYGAMVLKITLWFMALDAPTPEQSGVVMAIWGSAALIFNFYAKSGRAWGPQVEWESVGSNEYLAAQRDNFYGGARSASRRRSSPSRRRPSTRGLVKDEENEDELD